MTDVPQLPTEPQGESATMAFVSNALAIVGFIILFVIIVWGLFHIVNLSGSSIGGLFSSGPSVAITAPKTANAGEALSISWKYSGSESGTFSFSYPCAEDFAFATGAGNELARIPCGSVINVGNSTNATIVPLLSGTQKDPKTVAIAISFLSTDGKKTAATSTIAIQVPKAAEPQTPATTAATTPAPATKPATFAPAASSKPSAKPSTPIQRSQPSLVAHAVSGPADLSIQMILVGIIDPASGALIPRMPISPLETVGVEFNVSNIGGSASGIYYFTAQLPTSPQGYLYTSPVQKSLQPGEQITSVLRFQPNTRPGVITVTVDPNAMVSDANRGNNIVSQQL